MTDTLVFGQVPTVSPITQQELDAAIQSRVTPLDEYFDAVVTDSFQDSLPGVVLKEVELPDDDLTGKRDPAAVAAFVAQHHRYPMSYDEVMSVMERSAVSVMSEEKWKASAWYREGIPFDARMTEARAKYKAEVYDANQYRARLRENRPWSAATVGAAVLGSVVGTVPDPTNYIPIFGPAFKAANAARVGAILARAGEGAVENAMMAIATEGIISSSRRQFGDDVSFADQVMDVALAGFFGAGVGGVSGVAHGWRLSDRHPEQVAGALQITGRAAGAIVDNRPVDVGSSVLRAENTHARLSGTMNLMPVERTLGHSEEAPRPIGHHDLPAGTDQSVLGIVSVRDAERINARPGEIRFIRDPSNTSPHPGAGAVRIGKRHLKQILGLKDANGRSLHARLDDYVHDLASTYTHFVQGDRGRVIIAKAIPGHKGKVAVLELEPRHLSDEETASLIAEGRPASSTFYTVHSARLQEARRTTRRGKSILLREALAPAIAQDIFASETRSGGGAAANPGPAGHLTVSNFERRDIDTSVARETPKISEANLATAAAGLGKRPAFTHTGVEEQIAERRIKPEDINAAEEGQRLEDTLDANPMPEPDWTAPPGPRPKLVDVFEQAIDLALEFLESLSDESLAKFRLKGEIDPNNPKELLKGGRFVESVVGSAVHLALRDWIERYTPWWDARVNRTGRSGGRQKPDSMHRYDKDTLEFKPASKSGIRKGIDQTDRYRDQLKLAKVLTFFYKLTPKQEERLAGIKQRILTAKIARGSQFRSL